MRVLVLAGECRSAELLQNTLERAGYVVDAAQSSDDVLTGAAAFDYDVIVVDVGARPGGGLAVCRWLRTRGQWPILLLTGHGRLEERVDGLDAGADDCLQKPFAFEELSARLRALLRRRLSRQTPMVSARDTGPDRDQLLLPCDGPSHLERGRSGRGQNGWSDG